MRQTVPPYCSWFQICDDANNHPPQLPILDYPWLHLYGLRWFTWWVNNVLIPEELVYPDHHALQRKWLQQHLFITKTRQGRTKRCPPANHCMPNGFLPSPKVQPTPGVLDQFPLPGWWHLSFLLVSWHKETGVTGTLAGLPQQKCPSLGTRRYTLTNPWAVSCKD